MPERYAMEGCKKRDHKASFILVLGIGGVWSVLTLLFLEGYESG
jgi:hypothetical protein